MNKNKKFSLLLALVMVFSTFTVAFAETGDLTNIKDSSVITFGEWTFDDGLFAQVTFTSNEYEIEVGGKNYNLDKIMEKMEEGKTIEEAAQAIDAEEPTADLKVVEVSAIDTTKIVTVKATVPEAEEGATANVAIFAVDEEDERTAVANKDVEIEDGVVEVDFDIDTGNYVVVVTFEEETAEKPFAIDFEAANDAVDAVNNADTQIKLAKALENEYFVEYYVEENIVAYQPIVEASDYVTVDEIVEKLKGINKAEAAKGEFEAVKTALNAAKGNQLTIIGILNDNFEDVNSDYIIGYNEKIFDDKVVKSDIEDMKAIQTAIYDVNEEKADEAYAKAFKSLKAEDVAAARVAAGYLEDAEVATDAGITKQEFANDHLDVLDALIAVYDADSDKDLKSALVALDKLDTDLVEKYEGITIPEYSTFDSEDFDIDSVIDEQLSEYRAAIKAKNPGERNQRSDIQAIIDEANESVLAPIIEALSAVNTATDADAMKAVIEGAPQDSEVSYAEILGLDIGEDSDYAKLKTYYGDRQRSVSVDLVSNRPTEGYTLEELQAIFNDIVATRLVTQESMDLVNEAEKLEDISYITMLVDRFKEADYEYHSNKKISERIAELEGFVKDFNYLSEEYQEKVLDKVIEKRPDDGYSRSSNTIKALSDQLPDAVLNCAIETNDAAKLQELIVDANVPVFNNLSRAQRAEVVQFIIDEKLAADEYEAVESTGLTTLVEEKVGSAETSGYLGLIADVNNAKTKAEMQAALEEVYDVYKGLTSVQKLDVAEGVLAMITAEEDAVEFNTFAEIIAAVDTVIAGL